MAKARREYKFFPVKQFEWWQETRDDSGNVIHKSLIGQYIPGMSYNCTNRPVHDALHAKCQEWAKKGMIKIALLGENQHFTIVTPEEE